MAFPNSGDNFETIAHVPLGERENGRDAVRLAHEYSPVVLAAAASVAARRTRLHCQGHVKRITTRGYVACQCQMWAFHDGPCDDQIPAGDVRSSFGR